MTEEDDVIDAIKEELKIVQDILLADRPID